VLSGSNEVFSADHVMGLIPLIRTAMFNEGSYSQLRLQLYGPPGLRSFIRFNLNMTEVALNGRYTVHELLQRGEVASAPCTPDQMHVNEAAGLNIEAGEDGLWREILKQGDWSVDAGPIAHRSKFSLSLLGATSAAF
jgi:ribonuclease Z